MTEDVLVAAGVALVGSLVVTPFIIAYLRRRDLLDHPNHRSSHDRPVPRGAGAGIACTTLLTTTAAVSGLPAVFALCVATAGLAGLGGGDDVRPVSPKVRLAAQTVLAVIGAVGVARISGNQHLAATLLGIAAVVVYVNAFNFMDGINGISGTQAAIVGAAFSAFGFAHDDRFLAVAGATVAAAAVGFLPYNFPTAKAFLGDAGSYFLGGWLALLATRALAVGADPVAVALPFAVYLGDTGLTLLRRAKSREPLFEAHRDHVYQRLVRSGWSHTRTTVFVSAITAMCAIAAVVVDRSDGTAAALLAAGAGVATAAYLNSAPTDPERHRASATT